MDVDLIEAGKSYAVVKMDQAEPVFFGKLESRGADGDFETHWTIEVGARAGETLALKRSEISRVGKGSKPWPDSERRASSD